MRIISARSSNPLSFTALCAYLAPVAFFCGSAAFAQTSQSNPVNPPPNTAAIPATTPTAAPTATSTSAPVATSSAAPTATSTAAPAAPTGSQAPIASTPPLQLKPNQVAPFRGDREVQIEMPDKLSDIGEKFRIKNLATGKEIVIDIPKDKVFKVETKDVLVDSTTSLFIPEISIMIFKPSDAAAATASPNREKIGGYSFSKSLVFDQPFWRRVGFRTTKIENGGTRIVIDLGLRTKVLTLAQVEALQNSRGVGAKNAILEKAFKALGDREHTVAISIFSDFLQKPGISDSDRARAYLGRGMALFHKEGCKAIESDFTKAERDPKNYDDVSYFRGLCLIEAEKFDDAEGLFRELVKKESKTYGEKSRFYLGVIAENHSKYDEAESAYLDIIDFSSDKDLVALAKSRVEAVHRAKAGLFDHNLVTGILSLGLGYDSNVFVLPQSLNPSIGVSGKSDSNILGLASVEVKLPYSSKIDHRLRYTFLALHYSKGPVARDYDIQSHDLSTSAGFALNETNSLNINLDFNAIFKGPIASFKEYLVNPSVGLDWQKLFGTPQDPVGRMTLNYQTAYVNPIDTQVEGFDITAYAHTLKYRHQVLNFKPHVFGPGLDLEWRRAVGAQNTLFGAAVVGFWDTPIGPENWKINLSQEGAVEIKSFYDSAIAASADKDLEKKRQDGTLRYTASISHMFGESLETRLQFIGNFTDSSRSTNRYQKAQVNFLVSAFF